MVAVGCLALILLPLAGLVLGGLLGGPAVARWAALAGFALALALCGLAAYAMAKATRRR